MDNALSQTSLVIALTGNLQTDPVAISKYGYLIESIHQKFSQVDVLNAKVPSWFRWINALLSFNLNKTLWHEAFRKNKFVFRVRSWRISRLIDALAAQPDVTLQVGGLFDAHWSPSAPPNVIYTDYTTQLEFDRRAAGRSPFTAKTLRNWFLLEQRTYQKAAAICTRSELVKRSMIEDYGIPADKISVVGGGVNFCELPTLLEKKHSSTPKALFIGQNFHRKGGDLVLKAFAKAKSIHPDAELLFLSGSPVPADLPLAGVQVIAPVWDRAAIAELYQQADIFILPSRLETWGDVLLEAMAYALPCIGVYGEAMEEIIEHEKTGLLVPQEDVGALADALLQLLGDQEKRIAFGRMARQRVEQHYTWQHTVDLNAPLLEQAAQKRC